MQCMGFFFPYFLALGGLAGIWMGGAWTWLGVGLVFGFQLVLDEVIADREIQPGAFHKFVFHHGLAEASALISFPFSFVFLTASLWKISELTIWWEILGAVLTAGIFMGMIAITVAHELIHRRSEFQRALGVLNLALVNFCWYRISHIEIHHRWVATEHDPESSRAGEKVWPFWVRSISGSLRGAFKIEHSRSGFGFKNRFWVYLGLAITLAAAVFALGYRAGGMERGWFLILMWSAISLIAILLLETVNFIEHQGLVRAPVPGAEGRYEPVRAQHSWDSNHLLTNLTLFNLGYHSNHHLKASAEFADLGRVEGSMRMPNGYALMVLRALVGT